jgi:hypothetical protein
VYVNNRTLNKSPNWFRHCISISQGIAAVYQIYPHLNQGYDNWYTYMYGKLYGSTCWLICPSEVIWECVPIQQHSIITYNMHPMSKQPLSIQLEVNSQVSIDVGECLHHMLQTQHSPSFWELNQLVIRVQCHLYPGIERIRVSESYTRVYAHANPCRYYPNPSIIVSYQPTPLQHSRRVGSKLCPEIPRDQYLRCSGIIQEYSIITLGVHHLAQETHANYPDPMSTIPP